MGTLDSAIIGVLTEARPRRLPVSEIARRIHERDLFRTRQGEPPSVQQVYARIKRYSHLFIVDSTVRPALVGLREAGETLPGEPEQQRKVSQANVSSDWDRSQDWFWEGNIQNRIAAFLETQGWKIEHAADTAERERGVDLLARKDGEALAVEVKGYPSKRYASGPKEGQWKPTPPTLQARHWFGGALLSALLYQTRNPTTDVAIGLPRIQRYEDLAGGMETKLRDLGVGLFFVDELGQVHVEVWPRRKRLEDGTQDRRVAEALAELRKQLGRLYGSRLKAVHVYGSHARGEPSLGSDVDVAVISDRIDDYGFEIDRSSEIVADLSLRFDLSISRVFLSEDDWRGSASPFVANLRDEAVEV